MRGASRESYRLAAEQFDAVLRSAGSDGLALGGEFFAVSRVLDHSAQLRGSLANAGRSGDDRAALVRDLFGGKVDDRVVEAVSGLVRGRWSDIWDLPDAIELLGVNAVLSAAESADALGEVEEEVFRFGRTLATAHELMLALDDMTRSDADHAELIESLLRGKVRDESLLLSTQAAGYHRGSNPSDRIEQFGDIAAERRRRIVAVVVSATPLDEAQTRRLAAILNDLYGREVQLNLELDPEVLGGFRIQVGNEIVDASVAARLQNAQRRLAG